MSFFKKLLFFDMIHGHIHTSAAAPIASRTASEALTAANFAYLASKNENNCYYKYRNDNNIC